jgi:hypothetical protein
LEKLNILMKDFHEGKRAAPAFSQVTASQLDCGDEETWQNIVKDLREAGIDSESISSSRCFIRGWLDNVICDEDPEESFTLPDRRRTPILSIDERSAAGSPSVVSHLHRSAFVDFASQRSSSVNTHRSKHSMWRPVDQPNREYVQRMLLNILELKYTSEEAQVPIQRVFRQLDWLDRGYILRQDVERHCIAVLSLSPCAVSESDIRAAVRASDINNDGKLDGAEFSTLCYHLLDVSCSQDEQKCLAMEAESNALGFTDNLMYVEYISQFKSGKLWLPWNLPADTDSTGKLTTNNLETFSAIAFVMSQILIPNISLAQETWGMQLTKYSKEIRQEYYRAFEVVLDAALSLAVLENPSGPFQPSDLEGFQPLYCNDDGSLSEVFTSAMEICRSVQGFAFEMKADSAKSLLRRGDRAYVEGFKWMRENSVEDTPPSVDEWRRLKMPRRARHVEKLIENWRQKSASIQRLREPVQCGPDLMGSGLLLAIGSSEHSPILLRPSQRAQRDPRAVIRTIRINIKSANGLRRRELFSKHVPPVIGPIFC